jgi:putative peptidoglycan lipid II flippase
MRYIFGFDAVYCAAALTASAGIAGWIEFLLFRYALTSNIGRFPLGGRTMITLWGIAIASAAIAFRVKLFFTGFHVVIRGTVVLAVYGLLYTSGAVAAGIPEAAEAIRLARLRLSGSK